MERDFAPLDRLIEVNRLDPLMSDAKWLKLLDVLVQNSALIKECKVKLLWEEGVAQRQLLVDEDRSYNLDYYATAMEAMITGGPSGWYSYKEIEWLDFPKVVSHKAGEQDLEVIRQKIEEIGKFKMEIADDNLRLYAYLRP